MSEDAWPEYLAAAQRLDAVRRGAATAAGQQAQGIQTARDELTGVRARLAPQQTRLRALGVPEGELVPSPPEVAAAGQAMSGGPETVLAALRQARAAADAADAAVPVGLARPILPWSTARTRLVYAVAALAILAVLVGLCAASVLLLG